MQVAIVARGLHAGEADQLRRAMGHKRSRERMAAICQKLHRRDGEERHRARSRASGSTSRSTASPTTAFPRATRRASRCSSTRRRISSTTTRPSSRRRSSTRSRWASTRPARSSRTRSGTAWRCCRSTSRVLERGTRRSSAARRSGDGSRRRVAPPACVRLGIRSVRGSARRRGTARARRAPSGPFTSIEDFVRRAGLDRRGLRHLAEAGALDGLLPERARICGRAAPRSGRCSRRARGDAGPLAPRRRAADERRARAAAAANVARRAHRSGLSHDRRLARRPPDVAPAAAARAERRAHARAICCERARRRARRASRAGDLPSATGHGEGLRLPHARGRDGDW